MVGYLIPALKNLLFAIPTCLDVLTDGVLVYDYLHGANYSYSNITVEQTDCVADVISGDYKCWEQHYAFGFLTLLFMLLPGIGIVGYSSDGDTDVVKGLKGSMQCARKYPVCLLCCTLVSMSLSPVLVAGSKLVLIFCQGDEFENVSLYFEL